MLGAFFSPPYRDWWLAYIRDPTSFRVSGYHSHWLVRKSAADAFANGTIRLQRLHPSVIRVSSAGSPFYPVEWELIMSFR